MPKRILAADDSQTIRAALQIAFAKEPEMELVLAPDGQAVLKALQHEPFDLLLLDYNMPGLTGLELCLRVSQHPTSPPIVLLIGQRFQANLASQTGATHLLRKPFLTTELLNLVAEILKVEYTPAPSYRTSRHNLLEGLSEASPARERIPPTKGPQRSPASHTGAPLTGRARAATGPHFMPPSSSPTAAQTALPDPLEIEAARIPPARPAETLEISQKAKPQVEFAVSQAVSQAKSAEPQTKSAEPQAKSAVSQAVPQVEFAEPQVESASSLEQQQPPIQPLRQSHSPAVAEPAFSQGERSHSTPPPLPSGLAFQSIDDDMLIDDLPYESQQPNLSARQFALLPDFSGPGTSAAPLLRETSIDFPVKERSWTSSPQAVNANVNQASSSSSRSFEPLDDGGELMLPLEDESKATDFSLFAPLRQSLLEPKRAGSGSHLSFSQDRDVEQQEESMVPPEGRLQSSPSSSLKAQVSPQDPQLSTGEEVRAQRHSDIRRAGSAAPIDEAPFLEAESSSYDSIEKTAPVPQALPAQVVKGDKPLESKVRLEPRARSSASTPRINEPEQHEKTSWSSPHLLSLDHAKSSIEELKNLGIDFDDLEATVEKSPVLEAAQREAQLRQEIRAPEFVARSRPQLACPAKHCQLVFSKPLHLKSIAALLQFVEVCEAKIKQQLKTRQEPSITISCASPFEQTLLTFGGGPTYLCCMLPSLLECCGLPETSILKIIDTLLTEIPVHETSSVHKVMLSTRQSSRPYAVALRHQSAELSAVTVEKILNSIHRDQQLLYSCKTQEEQNRALEAESRSVALTMPLWDSLVEHINLLQLQQVMEEEFIPLDQIVPLNLSLEAIFLAVLAFFRQRQQLPQFAEVLKALHPEFNAAPFRDFREP